MRPLAEQVILITGATDGLGKAVAMQLARAGATLLLHGRDETRLQQTLEEIRAQTGNSRLKWYRADFAALAQVRTLAEQVAREQERLDVLLNNAGIGTTLPGGGRRQESEDGYELRFAVNAPLAIPVDAATFAHAAPVGSGPHCHREFGGTGSH
jgi:NAD(P)-dependent dehydrogenase (short-subunit alcohol dehydrogenase family)